MTDTGSTTDRLRQAFAAPDGEAPVGACPDPTSIWDAVHGRLPLIRTRGVVEHLAACPSCAADWRIAKGWEQPRAAAPMRWIRFATAAAIVLALFVFGVSRFSAPVPQSPVLRAGEESGLRSLLPTDEPLARDRAVLRWSGVGEEARYDVEVGTLELVPLASARDLEETEFTIPVEALRPVAAGASIVWRVEATLSDGRHVASEAFITPLQ